MRLVRLWEGPEGLHAVVFLSATIWALGLARMGAIGWALLVTHGGGALALRHWHRHRLTWAEQAIVHSWERACVDCRIVNVPRIRRKPNGRLDVRQSAASLTLETEIHRGDTLDLDDDEKKRVILKQGSQLAAMRYQLKLALGGDVAEVRVQERRGNHCTIIITRHVADAHQATVRVSPTTAVTVLSRQPNKAWIMNETLGGYVLAQHRYAEPYERGPEDDVDADVMLDDDEEAAWWVNDLPAATAEPHVQGAEDDAYDLEPVPTAPLSRAPLEPENPQVDPKNGECFRAGEGSGPSSPLPVGFDPPEGPPITWLRPPAPVQDARMVDVKTS